MRNSFGMLSGNTDRRPTPIRRVFLDWPSASASRQPENSHEPAGSLTLQQIGRLFRNPGDNLVDVGATPAPNLPSLG
jgi:hypothetical protein